MSVTLSAFALMFMKKDAERGAQVEQLDAHFGARPAAAVRRPALAGPPAAAHGPPTGRHRPRHLLLLDLPLNRFENETLLH